MPKQWPGVTVLIVTFDRPKEVREVIRALRVNLHYPGELRWHIADDSTPTSNYVPGIAGDFPELKFSHTITPKRSGWGVNVNTALRNIKTPYVFQIEDDQLATREINIEAGVFVMEHVPTVALVRYDGIEGHRLMLYMDETPKINGRRVHFLRIERQKTKGLNAYSNRPHLKHRRFHELFGLYPEGLSLGSTEETFAHHVLHAKGTPDLVALANGIERAFKHIGESRQLTKEDIGKVVTW